MVGDGGWGSCPVWHRSWACRDQPSAGTHALHCTVCLQHSARHLYFLLFFSFGECTQRGASV